MYRKASAVFGITTAPGHGVELTGLGELLQKERRGTLALQTRGIEDGSSVALGGLVAGGPSTTFVHGVCGTDISEVDDLKAALSRSPSGEFAFVADCMGQVMAGRDPIGGRPLYQGAAEGISVVSTIPSLLDAFSISHKPTPPGCLITLRAGLLTSERYAPDIQRKPFKGSLGQAAARVGALIRESLKLRLDGARAVAVAFSGGLDSSVLASACAKAHKVLLLSVSTEGSKDMRLATGAAGELGLELHSVQVTREDVERAISQVHLWEGASTMDRSLAAGFYLASLEAKAQGFEFLVAGQGADEIFGGYNRHFEAATADLDSLRPKLLEELPGLEAGLRRDELAISRGGCEPAFPYADFTLARLALSLPPQFLISRGERKVVLREVAKKMGLPPSIVAAPKRAFQYSSGIQDLISG